MGTLGERLHKLEANILELQEAGDDAARRLDRLEAEVMRLTGSEVERLERLELKATRSRWQPNSTDRRGCAVDPSRQRTPRVRPGRVEPLPRPLQALDH